MKGISSLRSEFIVTFRRLMVRDTKQDNSDEYRKTKKRKEKDPKKSLVLHACSAWCPFGSFRTGKLDHFPRGKKSVPTMVTHFPTPSGNQSSVMLQL